MQALRIHRIGLALVAGASVVVLAATAGRTQTQTTESTPKSKADPKINDAFKKPDVKQYVKKFESEDRENYAMRHEIVAALKLVPGMAVADIGAGTGFFTRLFAEKVGPAGKVYAVDIAPRFLEHIAADAKTRRQGQVVTILGSQDSTNLPSESVDLVFLSDVYHHLEKPERTIASIRQALRPGGRLVVIDFDRVEGLPQGDRGGRVRLDPDPQLPPPERKLLPALREARDDAHDAGPTALAFVLFNHMTNRVPDLDECLGFGVAPGQPGFLQIVGATAPLLAPVDRPAAHDPAIRQRVEDRRRMGRRRRKVLLNDARGPRRFQRGDGRRRRLVRAGCFVVSQQQREPSLDTPNMRPASASLQGAKIAHGITPKCAPWWLASKRSIRFRLRILYKVFFGHYMASVHRFSKISRTYLLSYSEHPFFPGFLRMR
jgi:ubiquinone/menaquinone biosynthesis C-methylase UbiE